MSKKKQNFVIMKKILTLLLLLCSIIVIAQPVQETVLTDNFTDPYTLKSEDLDENGHPDIIACGVGGIAWYSNDDGINFTKTVLLDSLSVVSDIEVIDFDFDTDIDIMGINASTGTVFWLENDGNENFTYNLITDTIADLRRFSAADMDNDGDTDFMFSISSGGFYNIYFCENTGSGFTSTYVDRVDFSSDIYIFDYDGDNDFDFLTKTNYSPFTTEELAIMVNDGSNSFFETQIYEKVGSIDITDAYFVDLTGNGIGDLIIADNVQNQLFWLWNSTSPRTILATANPTNVTVGDFNNDGVKDIVYKDEDSGDNDFIVLQGANPGTSITFNQDSVFDIDDSSYGLICLDTDGDNLPEFAYTSAARDEVAYFKNNDTFSFTLKKLSTNVSQPESLNYVDLDQDGDMDIVSISSNEEMVWLEQLPDGTYSQIIITSALDNPIEVKVNDVDDDGDLDIISASIGDDDFSIWYNDGNENFTEFQITSTSSQISNPSYFEITDLDNDGDKDFVIVGSSTSSTYPKGVFWIRNDGGGVYSSPITIKNNVNLMGQVAVYDFDGDGNKDIIVSNDEYGSSGIFIFKNNASASFFTLVSTFTSFRAVRIELGDIDGDGMMDFITRNDDDNDLVWFKGNGDLTFTPNTIAMSESRDVKFALVDDNNDGDTDIFFYTFYYGYTNGTGFYAGILNNDGSENFTQTYFLEDVHNMLSAIPLDIDYDSDIDFFVGMDIQCKISFYENLAIDLIDPTVTSWPTASDITFEQALSSSVLTGGSASVPGTFEFSVPSMTPNAGVYSASVKFIPDDGATYAVVMGTVDVTVHKADPTITTWPSASDIEYGQALSASVLSGGVASVSGTFTFDSPATTPGLGVYTANVTFTPDNSSNYNTVSGTVDVNIFQATPVVTTWPTATDITYGDALSVSTLSGGSADVPGTFTFDNPATIPNAGVYTADVTFTPDDAVNYNTVSGTVDVNVNQVITNVTLWPTASDITYGDALSASMLSGGTADVPGTFTLDNPATTPSAGVYTADVTFTPDDAVNYTSVAGTLNVNVNKADPIISTWPSATDINWGEDLTASSLVGGTADVPGTFTFDNPGTTPEPGVYTADVTFTPDDGTNYNTVNGTVNVNVNMLTPSVTDWPAASDITYTEALSASVLTGGTASVAGTFVFDNPATIPNAGVYTADVSFFPTDNVHYNSVSGTVDDNVNTADPIVTDWPTASDITYGDQLSVSVLSGGTSDVSGTFTFDNPTFAPNAGTYTADVTFTPDDATNYNTVSGTVDVNVNMADPIITDWPTASDITYGDQLSVSVLSGGTSDVSGTFTFDNPTFAPNTGTYTADVTFTPDDAANYNTVSGTVDVNVNMADPIITDWPTASDITYGDQLNVSVLTGGTSDISGTFTFDNPTFIPNAGTYTADVTFTPDDATNYNSVLGTVEVLVNKADQIIEWTQDLTGLVIGNNLTLDAMASSGLTVAYESNDTDVVTITGDLLEVVGTGSAIITASQDGNDNFNPADDVEKTIDILVLIEGFSAEDELNIYPVPAKDYIYIESSESFSSYQIIDYTGRIVYSSENNLELVKVDISSFAPGTYQVMIQRNDKLIIKPFVKQ